MFLIRLCALIFLLLTPFQSRAVTQEKVIVTPPQVTHISRIGNINLGGVNEIIQTQKGLIWLATTEGLMALPQALADIPKKLLTVPLLTAKSTFGSPLLSMARLGMITKQ